MFQMTTARSVLYILHCFFTFSGISVIIAFLPSQVLVLSLLFYLLRYKCYLFFIYHKVELQGGFVKRLLHLEMAKQKV